MKRKLFYLLSKVFTVEKAAKIVYGTDLPLWVIKIIITNLDKKQDKKIKYYVDLALLNYPKSTKSILGLVVDYPYKQIATKTNKKETKENKKKFSEEELALLLAEYMNKGHIEFELILKILQTIGIQKKFYLTFLKKIAAKKNWTAYDDALNKLIAMFPDMGTLYLRKAEKLASNNKQSIAHQYIKIGALTESEYIKFKRFGFEQDFEFPYNESLNKILETKNEWLEFGSIALRHIDSVNEDECQQITNVINVSLQNLDQLIQVSTKEKRIRILRNLVRMRYFTLAQSIANKYKISELKCEFDYIKNLHQPIQWAIDLADINNLRTDKVIFGLLNGKKIVVSNLNDSSHSLIELFIPTVFFSKESEEKITYKTVRSFYKSICDILYTLEDVIVVPRYQMNWRKYKRYFQNSLCICYHSISDERNTLIIQESQLDGRCSLDNQGFAGYSSLANDFKQINEKASSVAIDELERNFAELHNRAISLNVSKYPQSNEPFSCDTEFIFIPLQIPTDIVSKLAFVNTIDLLRSALNYANKEIKLVVKPHPYNNSSEIDNILQTAVNNPHVIVTSSSINSILSDKKCRAVLTTNSGVGLEAFIFSKPVFVAGKCDYAYAVSGFIKQPNEMASLFDIKYNVENYIKKQKEFLYFYKNYYTYASTSDDSIRSLKMRIIDQINIIKGEQ